MLNIIFITRFHPNEETAVEMAKLVAERLKTKGRTVTIIDLEKLRKGWRKPHWAKEYSGNDLARAELLLKAMREHNGAFFDFHDSHLEGMKVRYGTEEPSLELTRGGYYLVETPAVYRRQEDPKVSMNVEGDRLVNRYFDKRSDVFLSREKGFLSEGNVNLLTGKILEVVERREQYQKPRSIS